MYRRSYFTIARKVPWLSSKLRLRCTVRLKTFKKWLRQTNEQHPCWGACWGFYCVRREKKAHYRIEINLAFYTSEPYEIPHGVAGKKMCNKKKKKNARPVLQALLFEKFCANWMYAFYPCLDKCHRQPQIFLLPFEDFATYQVLASLIFLENGSFDFERAPSQSKRVIFPPKRKLKSAAHLGGLGGTRDHSGSLLLQRMRELGPSSTVSQMVNKFDWSVKLINHLTDSRGRA